MLKYLGKIFNRFKFYILVFITFIIVRLPLLGADIINTDAPVWKTRTFQFSNAVFSGDFASTNVTYHPGVTLMWLSAWGVKFFNIFSDIFLGGVGPDTVTGYIGMHFTQKLMIIIFLSFCITVSTYILSKIYSNSFAVLFFAMFTFEPYVLGLTRVLHTDGLITFTSFSSVLSLYYFYFQNKVNEKWIYISAVFGGLAMLTKSNGLFLLGISGMTIFVFELLYENSFLCFILNTTKEYLKWLFTTIVTFILFWPAMWVSPIEAVKNYYYGIVGIGLEVHYQAWLGVEVANPGPYFYPSVLFIRLTPWFILLAGSGILLVFLNFFKYKKLDKYLLLNLCFIVIYLAFLTISDKKLGRYALPVVPFLAMYAVFTLVSIFKALKIDSYKLRIFKNTSLSITFISVVVILYLNIISAIQIFPDYLAYYSPLIGGFNAGRNIEEPKWPIGYYKLSKYLNNLPGAKDRYILVRFGYLYNPFNISGKTGTLSQKTEKDPGAYFVLEKYSDYRYTRGKGIVLKKVIQIDGVDYFWIYEIIGDYPNTARYKFTFPPGMQIARDY